MSEWTHGFVIFLNLITLGFVIGEAIRGPSNILAPLWPSSTFLVHVEATHWRKPRHPWTPQVRGSAPTPQPSNSSSTTKRRPTAVHHPRHTPSHHLSGLHLSSSGRELRFHEKKKIKNRTREKKRKEKEIPNPLLPKLQRRLIHLDRVEASPTWCPRRTSRRAADLLRASRR